MNNIGTLLKLEIKNTNLGSFRPKEYKSWLKLLLYLVVLVLFCYLGYFASRIFFSMFKTAGIAYEALILFFTVVFILLVITGTSGTIKVLYFNGDNEILIRYPVNGNEIFFSKILFLLIKQSIITILILIPFLLGYSSIETVGSEFAYRAPLAAFFMIFITFFIANILAIPVMHLTNRIRNKFILIIIFLAVLVTALFAGYMWLFNKMVLYMKEQAFSVFDQEIVDKIKDVTKYLYPKHFADLLTGEKPYIAYPSLIIATGVGAAITYLIVEFLYFKTLLTNIEIEGSAFKRKTKNRVRPVFFTLLNKEFIQVFRSVNYSFQYFVLACAMPGMVFFSNSIVQTLAKQQSGERMTFGVTLLVMMVFTTIITSFAATSVSREGSNFYLTKVAPVSTRTQLFAKFTMYFIVSFLANSISLGVIVGAGQMKSDYAFITFAIVQLNAITLTLIAMQTDIDKPVFNLVGDGGEIYNNNLNTTRAVIRGMVISVVLGMLGMIFGSQLKLIIIVILSISIIAFIYAVLRYEINLQKRYYSINN